MPKYCEASNSGEIVGELGRRLASGAGTGCWRSGAVGWRSHARESASSVSGVSRVTTRWSIEKGAMVSPGRWPGPKLGPAGHQPDNGPCPGVKAEPPATTWVAGGCLDLGSLLPSVEQRRPVEERRLPQPGDLIAQHNRVPGMAILKDRLRAVRIARVGDAGIVEVGHKRERQTVADPVGRVVW